MYWKVAHSDRIDKLRNVMYFSSYILIKPFEARGRQGITIFPFPSLFCLAGFLYAKEKATPGHEY